MDEDPRVTAAAGDLAALEALLRTVAGWAGVRIDAATVTRLVPLVARTLADWGPLARAADPGLEPMGHGPERQGAGGRA